MYVPNSIFHTFVERAETMELQCVAWKLKICKPRGRRAGDF